VVNAVAVAGGRGRIVDYDTYIFQLRVLVMIIFVAAQAPELVSRDLRSHVLPLRGDPNIQITRDSTLCESLGGPALITGAPASVAALGRAFAALARARWRPPRIFPVAAAPSFAA